MKLVLPRLMVKQYQYYIGSFIAVVVLVFVISTIINSSNGFVISSAINNSIGFVIISIVNSSIKL